MKINERLSQKLDLRKEEGTYRELAFNANGIDFWSNDYLGNARRLLTVSELGSGSTGSRLISGNSSQIENLEADLARFFDAESALLFNSGYDANLGLLSSVPQKNDVVLYDEHIHASMRDGIRLSHAKSYSFAHNSLVDLEKKIKTTQPENGVLFVCVESLYSMGGDFCPLLQLIELCEKYGAELILDEAHSGGLYGQNGEGFSIALDLHHRIFARLYTFGKAYGCHGAVIVGSSVLRDYLINFSRSLIYTTALPPIAIQHIQEHVFADTNNENRVLLFRNCLLFNELCQTNSLVTQSAINSPIQMIQVGSKERTIALANHLNNLGFLSKAILSPTVKEGNEALRICLHAFNKPQELTLLVKAIIDFSN